MKVMNYFFFFQAEDGIRYLTVTGVQTCALPIAGAHSISIDLPDYEPARRETVTLVTGKTSRADFSLQPREPSIADATASEIVAALPGTNEQKHLFIQCDNCHSLQFALKTPRTKEGWVQIIRRMAGERAVLRETPGTRAFGQKKYVEPMAEYLASIRGPGSSDQIPFQLRPRPTGDAATRLVVTEYDIPRAGKADLSILRGDRRYVWPHDIILEPKGPYAYYTDHFSYNLGRRRSEEHTSELQSQSNLVCRLLLEKKKQQRHRQLSRPRTCVRQIVLPATQ